MNEAAGGISRWESLYLRGSFGEALGYAAVLWPAFDEIDDLILLSEEIAVPRDRQRLAHTLQETGGDRGEVERQYNLVEVSQFFAQRFGKDQEDDERLLALLLTETWKAKLSRDFPRRSFVVETFEDDWARWITFYEAP